MTKERKGLSSSEVVNLQKEYGFNEIELHNKVSPLRIFLRQLKSPLIYILLFAAFLSIILNEARDAIFILIVVGINSFLGFIQEYRAENSLELIKERVAKKIKVIRNGEKIYVETRDLVPGDIIVLEPGVKVPADGEILESNELVINEALITGESEPVEKDDKEFNNAYMGTVVVSGLGLMLVTKTGIKTKYGQIADTLSNPIDPETETTRRLKELGTLLTVIIVLISVIIIILGIYRNLDLEEIILTSVALGVSTIPEGLVIAYTIVLALGMNRIMKKKAIVKNLPAAETLGNIDILCIDKTGTITLGQMNVEEMKVEDEGEALRTLTICNNDANFIDASTKRFVIEQKDAGFFEEITTERIQLFPFSSSYKYTAGSDKKKIYMAGAPEKVFSKCLSVETKWKDLVKEKAKQGKRIIALASKKIESSKLNRDDLTEMNLIGLVFIADPVRETAKDGIKTILSSGIQIKVITGDLRETTLHIMREVGFELNEDEIMSGEELEELSNGENTTKRILMTKLFYRTTPDQKLKIVKILHGQGFSVGMMGDGVNDSPAIKSSEIGISVDSATDVSKEASDIVLLDSNFQTIVDSVEEGRSIFKNLRKIFMYLFGDSLSEVVLITFSILFYKPLPFLPLQILWINLVEDGLPSISLGFEKSKKEYLKKEHKPGRQSIFNTKFLSTIIVISLITDFGYFLLYSNFIETKGCESAATMMFTAVSVSSLLFIYSAKTIETNIWKENIFENMTVNLSVIFGFIMTLVALYSPLNETLDLVALPFRDLLIVLLIALIDILVTELIKLFMRRIHYRP